MFLFCFSDINENERFNGDLWTRNKHVIFKCKTINLIIKNDVLNEISLFPIVQQQYYQILFENSSHVKVITK